MATTVSHQNYESAGECTPTSDNSNITTSPKLTTNTVHKSDLLPACVKLFV